MNETSSLPLMARYVFHVPPSSEYWTTYSVTKPNEEPRVATDVTFTLLASLNVTDW